MNKKIKSIFIMFMGTGLNVILGVITVPIITHIVKPADYGIFSLLQTYISIFVTICLLGFEQAYVRYYYSENNVTYRSCISRKVIKYPLILSFGIAIIIICFGHYLIELDSTSFVLLGVCVIVTVIDTFTRLCIRLEQDTWLYSKLLVLHRIIYACIVIGFVLFLNVSGVNSLLYGTALSLLVIIFVAVTRKKEIWFGKSNTNQKIISHRLLFKYSYPFIFSSIAGWIFNATDKLALQHFSTYEQIGYYAAAANIVALITIVQTTFSTLWVPMAVQNFENDPENKNFYIKSLDLMVCIMFIAGATVVLFKNVFAWMLGGNYGLAKFIFPCLVLQPIMFTISETTVYGINFYKKTNWHIVITVCSCIANIIGNFILVPIYGGKGAAISTGLSYVVFFILRTVIANKYYKVSFHLKKMTIVLALLIMFFLYNSFFDTSLIVIMMYIIIVMLILRLYRQTVKEIFIIIKQSLGKKRIREDGIGDDKLKD